MISIVRTFLNLLTLAFTLWLIWLGYQAWQAGQLTPGSVDTSLLFTAFLVLSGVYFLAAALREGAARIEKKDANARKVAIYEGLLNVWAQAIYNAHEDERPKRLKEQLALQAGIALLGNAQVLRAMNQLQTLAAAGASRTEIEAAYTRLLMAMRTDIGLRNFEAKKELEQIFRNSQPPAV